MIMVTDLLQGNLLLQIMIEFPSGYDIPNIPR